MAETINAISAGMSHPFFSLLVIGIFIFVAFLILSGKLRKTSDGFELGDNTRFEKTNQRFKQLCIDTKAVTTMVPSMISTIEKINSRLTDVEAGEKRLELMHLMKNNPKENLLICKLYDEYKAAKLNSYIEVLFINWKKEYEQ
jgi:hypothetical protein